MKTVLLCSLLLTGCASQNLYDIIPALKTVDYRRGECLGNPSPSQAWDYTTNQCVQLTPDQVAESQRQSTAAWNKFVEDGRERQVDFERRYPAAAACMRANSGRFDQTRSGQLMEVCLSITREAR